MAYTGQSLRVALSYLAQLPDGVHFDTHSCPEGMAPCVEFQALTLAQAAVIRRVFPGTRWAKSYDERLKWWNYRTELPDGLKVHIYAVMEAPAACTAIVKKIVTVQKVPIAWEDREVEQEVVTGWDCGDGEEPTPNVPGPEAG